MSDKPPAYQAYPPQPYSQPQAPPYPPGPPPPGYPPQQVAYPPQAGYPAQQQHTTTTIIQQQPTVIVGNTVFGEAPVSMVCPYCSATIVTSVVYSAGLLTWLACGGLILVGCGLGCCLIPFCIDGLQDAIHSCPNCRRQLGCYRRM